MEKAKYLANELNIRHQVYFLGIRKDVPELMSVADGYVMSSSREGMSLVLLDASVVGLPIIATDVGVIEKLL